MVLSRSRLLAPPLLACLLLAACGGDGDEAAAPPVSPGPVASDSSSPGPGASGTTPPTNPTTSAPAVPTTIPSDFDLPELYPESDLAEASEQPVPDAGTGICEESLPGIDAATDSRFVERTAPEATDRLGLLVFADADAAVEFMDSAEQEAASCPVQEPSEPGRAVVVEQLDGPWGSGLAMQLVDVADDPTVQSGQSHLLLARIGSAVAVRYSASSFATPPFGLDAEVVAGLRVPLDELAPRMCVWTADGC